MTHQEKKYQALKAEYESVKKQLKQSMELIEEYTNKIGEWNNAFQSVAADRDFLIKCILDHKRLIQLPTEPDRLLYSNCKTLDFLGSGGYISGDDCRTLQVLSISVGMPEPKACIRVTIQAITNPVQILTKAEAKQAARASIPRAKKAQKPKVEASTHIEVEDASERSFFPTLDELREIARTSKSRSKEMAEHIARCCSA